MDEVKAIPLELQAALAGRYFVERLLSAGKPGAEAS